MEYAEARRIALHLARKKPSECTPLELAQWADVQRELYRHGQLDAEQIRKLETTPGWTWEGSDVERMNNQGA